MVSVHYNNLLIADFKMNNRSWGEVPSDRIENRLKEA